MFEMLLVHHIDELFAVAKSTVIYIVIEMRFLQWNFIANCLSIFTNHKGGAGHVCTFVLDVRGNEYVAYVR